MTWPEIHEALREGRETLLFRLKQVDVSKELPLPESTVDSDRAVASLLRAFAATLEFPIGTPLIYRDALFRVEQALDLTDFVACMDIGRTPDIGDIPAPLPDTTILMWLLIDYWHIAGVYRHAYRMQDPQL